MISFTQKVVVKLVNLLSKLQKKIPNIGIYINPIVVSVLAVILDTFITNCFFHKLERISFDFLQLFWELASINKAYQDDIKLTILNIILQYFANFKQESFQIKINYLLIKMLENVLFEKDTKVKHLRYSFFDSKPLDVEYFNKNTLILIFIYLIFKLPLVSKIKSVLTHIELINFLESSYVIEWTKGDIFPGFNQLTNKLPVRNGVFFVESFEMRKLRNTLNLDIITHIINYFKSPKPLVLSPYGFKRFTTLISWTKTWLYQEVLQLFLIMYNCLIYKATDTVSNLELDKYNSELKLFFKGKDSKLHETLFNRTRTSYISPPPSYASQFRSLLMCLFDFYLKSSFSEGMQYLEESFNYISLYMYFFPLEYQGYWGMAIYLLNSTMMKVTNKVPNFMTKATKIEKFFKNKNFLNKKVCIFELLDFQDTNMPDLLKKSKVKVFSIACYLVTAMKLSKNHPEIYFLIALDYIRFLLLLLTNEYFFYTHQFCITKPMNYTKQYKQHIWQAIFNVWDSINDVSLIKEVESKLLNVDIKWYYYYLRGYCTAPDDKLRFILFRKSMKHLLASSKFPKCNLSSMLQTVAKNDYLRCFFDIYFYLITFKGICNEKKFYKDILEIFKNEDWYKFNKKINITKDMKNTFSKVSLDAYRQNCSHHSCFQECDVYLEKLLHHIKFTFIISAIKSFYSYYKYIHYVCNELTRLDSGFNCIMVKDLIKYLITGDIRYIFIPYELEREQLSDFISPKYLLAKIYVILKNSYYGVVNINGSGTLFKNAWRIGVEELEYTDEFQLSLDELLMLLIDCLKTKSFSDIMVLNKLASRLNNEKEYNVYLIYYNKKKIIKKIYRYITECVLEYSESFIDKNQVDMIIFLIQKVLMKGKGLSEDLINKLILKGSYLYNSLCVIEPMECLADRLTPLVSNSKNSLIEALGKYLLRNKSHNIAH